MVGKGSEEKKRSWVVVGWNERQTAFGKQEHGANHINADWRAERERGVL